MKHISLGDIFFIGEIGGGICVMILLKIFFWWVGRHGWRFDEVARTWKQVENRRWHYDEETDTWVKK